MRRGLETLGFSFDESHLTHFGGMVLMQRFCKQLRLRHRLQRAVRLPQRPGEYAPTDVMLALLFAIIAGLRRLNKTEVLQYNGAFLSLLGLASFPDQSTFRRFLKRLPTETIRQVVRVHDQLRRELSALPQAPSSLIFDIDSVVLTLYGQQQGARVGYNVAFFHLVLLAFDLAHWFKRLCLPPEYLHATLETLRTDLLVVPARLVRRGGRNVLHLPREYRHRELFERAFQRARRLKVPAKS